MNILAIIPARYASTRFPGKPLAMLHGKPVIQHVYNQVAAVLPDTYVATDDKRIFNTVNDFGGRAVMTSPCHRSGTDRVMEAVRIVGKDHNVAINIQGDEPFICAEQIRTLCRLFEDSSTEIATLGKRFDTIDEVENPNSPKIVIDNKSFALYFSRSVVPYIRGAERAERMKRYPFLKHIGIYGYRTDVLEAVTNLPPSSLEMTENLEQLRWLENGYRIKVGITDIETIGIDTPDDLKKAEQYMETMMKP